MTSLKTATTCRSSKDFVFMRFLSIFVNSNNLNNQYLECYEKKNLPYELHRGYFHDHPVLGVC